MTNPTPLSPAAQAVLDAANGRSVYGPDDCLNESRWIVAAALRAAADQVVPKTPKPSANSDYHLMNWTKSLDQYYQREQTRDELLAIAAELEGAND
jgi:hypothetical protein